MPKDSTEVILAFDYGERRIGVAVGQDITNSASPLGTLKNSKLGIDWAQIKQWIEEWQPNLLVVGLPLSENNVTSDIQNYIKSFVKQLSKFNLPINMIDESYSEYLGENWYYFNIENNRFILLQWRSFYWFFTLRF